MELDLINQITEPTLIVGGQAGFAVQLETGAGNIQLEDGTGNIEIETGP